MATTKNGMTLYNLRQKSACFGGMPSEHDFCHVYSNTETVPHPLTGKPQPKLLFWGTLKDAHAFMDKATGN